MAVCIHQRGEAGECYGGSDLPFRNVIALATRLILFGVFTAFGPALRFAITKPLFDL